MMLLFFSGKQKARTPFQFLRNLVFKTSRRTNTAALLSKVVAENKGIEPSFQLSPKTRLAGERNQPIVAYSPYSTLGETRTHNILGLS